MIVAVDNPSHLRKQVLSWGTSNLRDLPWRRTRDPWTILVSETMLQQTQVSRVVERLPVVLNEFPDPATCAASTVGDVVTVWAGLGYNRRPVMLHRAATQIVSDHAGAVPSGLKDLLALPGVGPYTARAVRAFAFELSAAVVDTNIGRFYARIHGRKLSAREVQQFADEAAPEDQPWLWNQSIMELGALVCTKRSPMCDACPVVDLCAWVGEGDDPAQGSAAVSVPQTRFEGSDRQLRGRLVDVLRASPLALSEIAATMQTDADRAELILAGLQGDGLVVVKDRQARLP
ncbi:MAG: A/G-specific adenine glycosylase [Acidimicrobiaceae bacterium]|nr:A/G-specific adenine glycosylase [Acidimicrobiaceae bacterium]